MATALIKITQGPNTDVGGNAVIGTTTDGGVVFSNDDNTDVLTWEYEVLNVPPGSAIPLTVQGPNATPTFTMGQPDLPGSYRVRLTVVGTSNIDVDIRNIVVPFPNRGFLVAPYQGIPIPLPLEGTGSKPDEMNVGGQAFGWAGDDDPSRPMMYQILEFLDGFSGGSSPPLSNIAYTDKTSSVVSGNNGAIGSPWLTVTDAVAALAVGGDSVGVLVTPGNYSAEAAVIIGGGFTATLAIHGIGGSAIRTVLPDMQVQGGSAYFDNVDAGNLLVASSFLATNCTLPDTEAFNIDLEDCDVGGLLCDGGSFITRGCKHNSDIFTSGTLLEIRDATFVAPTTITFSGAPGILKIDYESWQSAVDAGGLTVNGGDIQFPVVVPVISTALFVDQATTEIPAATGSIDRPYASLTGALATFNAGSPGQVGVLVGFGDYTGEPTITIDSGFAGIISLAPLVSNSVRQSPFLPEIVAPTGASLSIVGMSTDADLTVGVSLFLSQFEKTTAGTFTVGATFYATDCTLSTTIDVFSSEIHDSTLASLALTCNGTGADAVAIFRNCKFGGTNSVIFAGDPGIVDMDEISYESSVDAGGLTVTNGTIRTPGPVRGEAVFNFGTIGTGTSVTISVSVPGLSPSLPVAVSPQGDLPGFIVMQAAYQTTDTLNIQLFNTNLLSAVVVNSVTFDFLAGTARTRSIT